MPTDHDLNETPVNSHRRINPLKPPDYFDINCYCNCELWIFTIGDCNLKFSFKNFKLIVSSLELSLMDILSCDWPSNLLLLLDFVCCCYSKYQLLYLKQIEPWITAVIAFHQSNHGCSSTDAVGTGKGRFG